MVESDSIASVADDKDYRNDQPRLPHVRTDLGWTGPGRGLPHAPKLVPRRALKQLTCEAAFRLFLARN